jgi:beta-glucanase (GH16 family)/lysophospholipase L1-like esterase
MRLRLPLLATLLISALPGIARAAALGTDNASAPAYAAGWSNGSDGGITGTSAFGQWFLNTNLPSAYTIASAAGVGNAFAAAIDSSGVSFRLFQTNTYVDAYRYIDPSGLGVGQTFTVQMAVNFRDGFKGIDLRSSASNEPTIFNLNVGGEDYTVNGAATGNGSVGNTYSANTVFTLSFTQTNWTGGSWSVVRSGGVSSTNTGTYTGAPRSIKLYNSPGNSLAENALFVNNLSVTPVPGTSQQILIDFGQTPTTNAISGKFWNNVTNTNSLSVNNLLDAAGAYSGYSMSFSVTPLMNNVFAVTPNAGLGEFNETNVVLDGIYTDTNRSSSTFKISRLNRSNAYTFRLFGSRSATQTRVTSYTLAGSDTFNGALTNSGSNVGGTGINYNTNVLTFSNVVPDRNGEVTLTFTRTAGDFGYLNALSVSTTNFPDAGSIYVDLANRWIDQDALGGAPTNPVIFIGSSSIRRWEALTRDFADYSVIQRGMGGAWFSDVNQVAADLVIPRSPRALVIWAGVNDIYNGQTGDHVFQQYTNFVSMVTNALPETAILYIGMTRNPGTAGNAAINAARTNANSQISAFVATNGNPRLRYIDLPAFFENIPLGSTDDLSNTNNLWHYYVDTLHLNDAGYRVWGEQIRAELLAAGVYGDRAIPDSVAFSGGAQKVLFDFGPSDGTNGDATAGPDERGNHWNNWHTIKGGATIVPGERVTGLVDSAGNSTGLAITITAEFMANGKLSGGLTNIPSLALGNLGAVTATQDYFFSSSDSLIGGGDDDDAGGLRISGLNPSLTYDLRLFGSRNTVDTRETSYAVYGAATNPPVVLQTSGVGSGINGSVGNDRSAAVFSSVRPNAYGDIFIDLNVQRVSGNNNYFAYVNAMELTALSPFESWARANNLSPGIDSTLTGTNSSGVPNLWTFAFDGTRSSQAGSSEKFGHGFNQFGEFGALSMTMPIKYGASFSGAAAQAASIAGVEYEIQGSTNLVDWNFPVEAAPLNTSGMPALSVGGVAGYEYRTFRLRASAAQDKGFIRAVVRPAAGSAAPMISAVAPTAAASYRDMSGIQLEPNQTAIGHFDAGDWVKYEMVDFGSGATSATFSAAKSGGGGAVEIRLGSPTGRLIGTLVPQNTGGWGNYREQLVQLSGFVSGVQDVYLVGTGATGIANIASFRFSKYVLTWSDEFSGSTLNTNNWSAVDNGDVANGELQFYTPRTNNVTVEGGVLKLTAHRETYTGQGPWMSAPKTTQYTSGLVESLNKVEPQYGKIEASMKIPRGAGLWPAFWMMGVDYFTGAGWPLCGEIDIMEYSGASGGFTAAFHTGAYNYLNGGGGVQNVQGFSLSDYDTAFHVYGIEWTPTRVAFYVDGRVILTADKSVLGGAAAQWPFDQPFWLKLNLAVGGPYGGDPTSGTFPKTMEVDWVRVYQEPD